MQKQLPYYFSFLLLFSFTAVTAQQNLWHKTNNLPSSLMTLQGISPGKYLLSQINSEQLRSFLRSVPLENTNGNNSDGIPFSLPLPDGNMLTTFIAESPIWNTVSTAQLGNLKTYILFDRLTKSILGRLTLTEAGISGIIFSDKGAIYINPVVQLGAGVHVSYFTKDETSPMSQCGGKEDIHSQLNTPNTITSGDCKRRTYRLAVAATGEYTQWAGSQANALAYITITINNISALYNRDVNIRFSLVSPNSILFTDPNTDPYPGTGYLDNGAIDANQIALDAYLGTNNYDLGIVFSKGWDRGYALFGVACNAALKGKSAAGITYGQGANPVAGPQGFVFDLTVAHEIGHQFNATHSYASSAGFCNGFATAAAAFEPGGGSTLMSYGGYSSCNTYVGYAEMYFHAGSIQQIAAYISSTGNCVIPVVTGNNPPVVSVAATSYNIPISTPFILSATGSGRKWKYTPLQLGGNGWQFTFA